MIWKCPKCSSGDLRVVVEVWARLHQSDDNFETDVEGDHEWDGDSAMECVDCGHSGEAHGFDTESLAPWVIVEQAGYANELVVAECDTYDDAWTAYHELYEESEREELHVDIMKRLPDGSLTTEY